MDHPSIVRLDSLIGIEPLAACARAEGFSFLDRMIEEWSTGTNRFEREGEALFGVVLDGKIVATTGVTRQRAGLGRIRRVYVDPDHRRTGLARELLRVVLAFAKESYPEVVLFTDNPVAARMYEGLGFHPESPDGLDHATHRLGFHSAPEISAAG